MIIHNIRISNFKSLYGEHYFDFDKCKGLIKLSGPIGSGKTSLAEAIIWGLFGNIKGQTNTSIVSWNEKVCEIELNITSNNKQINIKRNLKEPLYISVDGKTIAASNKKDTQQILEEELLDVPKLAIVKMCIISFSQFNSLANMNPAETKQFLDDIFGFKLFTEYNNIIVNERKIFQNEIIKLEALFEETNKQIETLKEKKDKQKNEIINNTNISKLNEDKSIYLEKGIEIKTKKDNIINEKNAKIKEIDLNIREIDKKIVEITTLGKQARNNYNTFKSGICPTCGQKIEQSHLDLYKNQINECQSNYENCNKEKQNLEKKKIEISNSYNSNINDFESQLEEFRSKINLINSELKTYNESIELINNNYDELISEYEAKLQNIDNNLKKSNKDLLEWDELSTLFTKTLRYRLLETLIPHINKSIQYFINKLDQSFSLKFDQEFKAHIYVEYYNREIAYNNLSTGQKKTLDLAIIFGILQNIMTTIDTNIIFLDELFSNMDADARNIMLSLLNESISDNNKSIFVVNHAEMQDDYFDHKIRVKLENKKLNYVINKENTEINIKCSKYIQEF